MMGKKCIGCKQIIESAFLAKVFNLAGAEVAIGLCREHDIELYKIGQIKFFAKYNVKLAEVKDSELEIDSPSELLKDFV